MIFFLTPFRIFFIPITLAENTLILWSNRRYMYDGAFTTCYRLAPPLPTSPPLSTATPMLTSFARILLFPKTHIHFRNVKTFATYLFLFLSYKRKITSMRIFGQLLLLCCLFCLLIQIEIG